ncbi:MAG: VWA domain-containing protein [Terracidiphilus sp.]
MYTFSAGGAALDLLNELSKLSQACATLVLCASSLGFAGQEAHVAAPQAQHAAVPPVTRDEAGGLIHLDALVLGPSGRPVSGLRPEDFTILDNGTPEKILSFHASDGAHASGGSSTKPDPPSRLILVIDDIDTMPDIQSDEHVAVGHYLRKNGGHLTRPVSVYLISGLGLWTVSHPAGDGNAMADDILHNRLKSIRPFVETPGKEPSGRLVPDTAAMSALKSIGQIATEERRRPGRKLLIWVGPGVSLGKGLYGIGGGLNEVRKTMTKETLDTIWWFSLLMREARIVLYTFTVGENDPRAQFGQTENYVNGVVIGGGLDPPKGTYMSRDRKALAVNSGGLVMEGSFAILEQIESCVREADTFYTLTFDPAHADSLNEHHDLKVLVNKPELTSRTTAAYFDQPWYAVDRYPAVRAMTVKQLEQMLAESRSESDAEIARQLSNVEMSERLSEARLSALGAAARGKRTREGLRILADASAFLDPSAEEIPTAAPPEPDAQRRMLSLTAEYLTTTIHKLPNYLAKRTTVRYQETPQLKWGQNNTEYQPLHDADTLSATVYYRNGSEVAEQEKHTGRKNANDPQLDTYGTFGPILAGVLNAIARGAGLTWIRWERGAAGPVAVFRYAVPAEISQYQAKACCLPDGDGKSAFLHVVGYRGEIAIDPQNGAVFRLEQSADLKSSTPIAQDKILVEYGLVDIGGMKYVCPVRSISMMRLRAALDAFEWDESFLTYGPYATMLNETEFSNYRLFRGTARILPGFIPAPDDK